MLEKTLRLLDTLAPGVYVPPERRCYDETEILELGAALNKLLYSPSQLRSRLQGLGVNLIPANFYSEIPTVHEVEQSAASPPEYSDGFDQQFQARILSELMPFSEEFDPPITHATPDRFSWTGGQFSHSDAMAYYCFIRKLRPQTIIEIGSGWSTLVAEAAIRANGSGRIICVEPYPQPFLSEIVGVDQLVQQPVQTLSREFFNEHLADGDLLFIDSTHTVKHGSDCLHIYLNILPHIDREITVHVHDIFLPDPLPTEWLRDLQIYWTEQYLLYAYLIDNLRTKIIYSSNYHSKHNREQLKSFMHGRFTEGGASLWFTQRKRVTDAETPRTDIRATSAAPEEATAADPETAAAMSSGTAQRGRASAAAPKFVLPSELRKADAVSFLAEQIGATIGNPWQSSTIGQDIEHLAAEIAISANDDVGFVRCADLADAQEMHVFSTQSRRIPPPHAANFRHSMFQGLPSDEYSVTTPDFSVLSLRDGYICHFLEAPVIVAPDGQTVVRDYSSNYSGLIHFHPQRLRDCTAQARYIDGIVVPIADDVQLANIFHWIIDWLPRLAFLGPAVRKRDVFVATSPLTAKFQRETLRLCGVDEDRIITVGNFEAIQARELLVPSNLGEVVHPGFTAAPWVMSYLRSTLGLGALRQASLAAKAGDRVYVSRRDAAHRRVTNEDELLARLADAGFREVALSSLPLVDQIATFANADSVIGLHGAGLIHFAFTPPGARLLEILPQSYAIPTLYVLAAGLGGEYLSYVTDQIVPGTHPSFDDVAMDVDDFAERCRSFLA